MQRAIDETNRRREIQERYNREHNITPQTILKPVDATLLEMAALDYYDIPVVAEDLERYSSEAELQQEINSLEEKMKEAAEAFEFEKAAEYRDRIKHLRTLELQFGGSSE